MAHAAKYKQSDTVALAIHYERREGCELSNRDIDRTKTYMNYNLAQELQPLRTEKFVKQRLSEIHHMKRKDIIVMVDWIVTLPKNVSKEDEGKFFELTYKFLKDKYGKKNVIAAWVHKDEKTPHIHFSFLPVINEDNKEKLNCKKVITRQELKEFHPSLGSYLEKHLGYLPEIQNDATVNGNRTIKELKAKDDLSFYNVYKNVNNHLQASKDIISKAEAISFENSSFMDKSKTIKKCNQVIDQLKYSNKILESDTIELRNLVYVQKREIDGYRDMPLAKQINQKEYVIDKQNDEIDSLERKINLYKYDNDQLNNSKNKLKKKIESLEKEILTYKSFLSVLGIDKIYEVFKREFIMNDFSIDIRYIQNICKEVLSKVSAMFETIKERITILDNKNIDDENINVRHVYSKKFKDIEH